MAEFGTPYWWEDGQPLPDLPSVPPTSTEMLVVGAGYTGLSAAITTNRAGVKVTVIDGGIPGQGASSRNGGMCGAHTRISVDAMTASFGADAAKALIQEAPAAYAFTRDFIKAENIACDFQQTGRIVLSSTAAAQAEMIRLARQMKEISAYDLAVIPKPDLASHIRSEVYAGGVYYADHGALQPRKFHDGLMAIALAEGVNVVQNCHLIGLSGREGAHEVTTSTGPIKAEKLILATNGYTRRPLSWLARRVFPLPSFIIATEPLPDAVVSSLAPGRRMMVETRARHSYYRVSPDGSRIIFGGRAGMVPYGPHYAAKRLRATMIGIWPDLRDVKITHSWRGYTGFTFEQMPHVGSHMGAHFAVGYSGSGVALAPYLGMKVAYRALGDKRGDTAYAQTFPTTRPYHFGDYPWFLTAGELWYRQVVDRWEDYQAARGK